MTTVELFDLNELRILYTGWTGKRYTVEKVKLFGCYKKVGGMAFIAEGINPLDAENNCDAAIRERALKEGLKRKGEYL